MSEPHTPADPDAGLPDPLPALFIGAAIDGRAEPARPTDDPVGTETPSR